jgi:hypothetical protein
MEITSVLSLKTTVTQWELCREQNHTDIWKLGLGYEMPCGPVDGMNPVSCRSNDRSN